MGASDYLRAKFQSDRHLALNLQKGFNEVLDSATNVAATLYSGVERLSWYSSCFIPGYDNVCKELLSEEVRTLYSIASIFKHQDVIRHMLFLYLKSVCDDIKEGNPEGSARKLIANGTYIAGSTFAAMETRYAFAYAMSAALSQSEIINKCVIQKLAVNSHAVVQALHLYGFQQKAALSARRLKAHDPEYYWILYQSRMEMLYYFIDPVLFDVINKVKKGVFDNLDELTAFMREKYGV